MRISKKVGPARVRWSSSNGFGFSIGSNGTRISTSTRKGKGKLAGGCVWILLLFVALALILAVCDPGSKDDAPETEAALSAVETESAEETEAP